jgi:hypothetical protein
MSDVPLPETFLVLSRLQSGTEEVCRLDEAVAYAAAVSADLAAENARLHAAIRHYEAALKEAWPEGARGKSFEHWDSARIAIHGSQP